MANLTVTNLDIGSVVLEGGKFDDNLLTFAGADTFVSGTILALDSISLKWVIFVKGGVANENGIPKAVLTQDITATGAGDVATRALIAGSVRKQRLVIDADGDDSNIDKAVIGQLQDYSIIAISVEELNILDNQ